MPPLRFYSLVGNLQHQCWWEDINNYQIGRNTFPFSDDPLCAALPQKWADSCHPESFVLPGKDQDKLREECGVVGQRSLVKARPRFFVAPLLRMTVSRQGP